MRPAYVYAYALADTGLIKIGVSQVPEHRFDNVAYPKGAMVLLRSVWVEPDAFVYEKHLHAIFEPYRYDREWFRFPSDDWKICFDNVRGWAIEQIAELERRFWEHVEKCAHPGECRRCCWPWTGKSSLRFHGTYHTPTRLALTLKHHALLLPFEGIVAAHQCDNTLCCNPKHLFWATAKENRVHRKRKRAEAGRRREA
jgi:hypothetical protein